MNYLKNKWEWFFFIDMNFYCGRKLTAMKWSRSVDETAGWLGFNSLIASNWLFMLNCFENKKKKSEKIYDYT